MSSGNPMDPYAAELAQGDDHNLRKQVFRTKKGSGTFPAYPVKVLKNAVPFEGMAHFGVPLETIDLCRRLCDRFRAADIRAGKKHETLRDRFYLIGMGSPDMHPLRVSRENLILLADLHLHRAIPPALPGVNASPEFRCYDMEAETDTQDGEAEIQVLRTVAGPRISGPPPRMIPRHSSATRSGGVELGTRAASMSRSRSARWMRWLNCPKLLIT